MCGRGATAPAGDGGGSGADGDLVDGGQADTEAFRPARARVDRDALAAGCGHEQTAPVGRTGHRILVGAAEREVAAGLVEWHVEVPGLLNFLATLRLLIENARVP